MTDPVSNYCPELWQRMFLHQSNRTFVAKPCCYYQEPDQPLWITQADKISNIYNQSVKIQRLRQENQQGKLGAGCKVCAHAEQAGMESGRLSALKRMTDSSLVRPTRHLDLNLGNLCNLACAICDPHSSTSWVPIYQAMQHEPWPYHTYDKHDRPVIDDPELFENLETIQLQGGEVFLQSAYVDFFSNLARMRDLGEIRVVIFSNGTVIPQPALWSLLCRCASVDLYFSIDDTGARFEYQRHGARWDRVLENLSWFDQRTPAHFSLGFHPTYSLLNIYYLCDLWQFMHENFPTWQRRWGPYHVGTGPCIADAMPDALRAAVIDRHQRIDEFEFLSHYIRSEPRNLDEFFDYIRRYDRATNSSYAQAHSEFWSLLQSV
jgi:hypothetical protein